jgi:hypothetical protein
LVQKSSASHRTESDEFIAKLPYLKKYTMKLINEKLKDKKQKNERKKETNKQTIKTAFISKATALHC